MFSAGKAVVFPGLVVGAGMTVCVSAGRVSGLFHVLLGSSVIFSLVVISVLFA